MRLKPLYSLPFTLFLFMGIILNSSCANTEYYKTGGMVWNTMYSITYDGPAELADSIMPILNTVSNSASVFDSTSLISRINRNETDSLDPILLQILSMSLKVNSESGGKFDPTVGPLIEAWGFGKGHTPTSDTARIDDLLKYVGIAKTRISNNRLVKPDSRMRFNFSAIAKGLGCDAVAEMFERNGVTSYLIEIGGEIRVAGLSPRHTDWNVSIDSPIPASDSVIHKPAMIIDANKGYIDGTCGIATSGNYRNFHSEKGKTYGHTIDPATGRPAQTDVVSATVVSATAMQSDAYATAIMAMGSKPAIEMCLRLKLAACIITDDSKVWQSPQFKKMTR